MVTNSTIIEDLKDKFGDLLIEDRVNEGYINYYLLKIDFHETTFNFGFHFHNQKLIHVHINPISVYTELYNKQHSGSWDDFDLSKEVNYRAKWLSDQIGEPHNFALDGRPMGLGKGEQRYEFEYGWGKIGVFVFMVIHGISYECSLIYKK